MSTREDELWKLIAAAERKKEREDRKITRWLDEVLAMHGGSLTFCVDCGIDAWDFMEAGHPVHEDFYVHDTLWQTTVPEDAEGDDGVVLCIGCFETRLGRRLTPADFKSAGARDLFGTPPSSRFIDRATQPR